MENYCLKCGEVFGRFEEKHPFEEGFLCARCYHQVEMILSYEPILPERPVVKEFSLESYETLPEKTTTYKDFSLDGYETINQHRNYRKVVNSLPTNGVSEYEPISKKTNADKERIRRQRKRANTLRNVMTIIVCVSGFSLLALTLPQIVDMVQEYQKTGTVTLITDIQEAFANLKELLAGYISFLKFS